jgi:hypothetical protein
MKRRETKKKEKKRKITWIDLARPSSCLACSETKGE